MYTKYGNSFVTLLLQEIPIEPRRGLFFYLEHPPPASLWKFLFNVFALNVLSLILSLPTRISNDPWWGGCGSHSWTKHSQQRWISICFLLCCIIDNELIKYEKLMIVLDLTLFPICHKHLPKRLTTSSFQLLNTVSRSEWKTDQKDCGSCSWLMFCKLFIHFLSYVQVRSQGPAVTLKIIYNRREYSVDLTLAIKDNTWPEDAEEWITRRRNGNVLVLPIN